MGSQERFVENGREVSSLLSIRDELYRNTLQIIELVRERMKLAEEIGSEKESLGMPLRNRERELEVLESIPGLGSIEKSVLNMIFELTILNEANERPSLNMPNSPEGNNGGIFLEGPDHLLQYSLGLIVSHPGFELQDSVGVPENLALGVIQRGGHITSSASGRKEDALTLVNSEGEKLASIRDGQLVVSRSLLNGISQIDVMEAI